MPDLQPYEIVQQAWSRQRWDEWLATCADDYTFHPARGLVLDRDVTMMWNRALFAAFPDYAERVLHAHSTADTTVYELAGTGTSMGDFILFDQVMVPATGKSFEIIYAKVLVFNSEGLVTEDRQYSDRLDLYSQLGTLKI